MTFVVEASGLRQSFRTGFWLKKIQILHDINFQIPSQSVYGFLGANGAGKTTLIHLMTGLRQPSAGHIRVFGFEAHSVMARSKIGYLPERPYFYEHLTGESLLKHYGTLSGWSAKKILDRIPIVLSWVGMSAARHLELRKYSKGMLQRIGIAQALIHDPEFLILDEPMSGLDPFGRKEMRELIASLSAQGRTLFFSSHVIPDVEAICSHVALIERGKIVVSGLIKQFLETVSTEKEVFFSDLDSLEDTSYQKGWPEFESLRRTSEGWCGLVRNQEVLNQVLLKLLKHQAKILSVHPVRTSLENVFSQSRART